MLAIPGANGRSQTLADYYRAISGDILKFCRALRFDPMPHQREFLLAVQDATYGRGPRQIAVKSGQGTGKTAVTTVAGLWRALWDVDSRTVVTAPTMRQNRDIWLVEIRALMAKADPILQKIIKVTKSKVEIMGRNHSDWGVVLATATKDTNVQGYHNPNLTIIGEESSGIAREIITQFKGTLTNQNSLFILIGNPNTRDCAFFDCFYGPAAKQWKTMTFDSLAVSRVRPDILHPSRNQRIADEFGVDSDVYRIRVLGEFPKTDPNCVIGMEDLLAVAGEEHILRAAALPRPDECGGGVARQFGIDHARYGGDENVVMRRSGNAIVQWGFWAGIDPARAAEAAFRMQVDAGWRNEDVRYVVDAGGIGQGVMHRYHDAGKRVVEFHNGGRAHDSISYGNRITEAWFRFAKMVRARQCAIPMDQRMLSQLAGRQYYTNAKGRLVLEDKDDFIKRGYDSPDRAEALVYALYDHVETTGARGSKDASEHRVGLRTANG